MKYLPDNIQNVQELIKDNYIYVDKTKGVYELIKRPKGVYFLSRPRRFGKSLLISTLEEIFRGNKELFKEQWLYTSDYDWKSYPVIRLDMSEPNSTDVNKFLSDLENILEEIAESYGIKLSYAGEKAKFRELINKLEDRAVVLIDEYDKPILDNIGRPEVAQEFREILKNFYTVLKVKEPKLRFIFVTGVSKFSQVSIFSGLNNLVDITESEKTATLLGITQDELEKYFAPYIDQLATKESLSKEQTLSKIKYWYNGYRFSDKDVRVYNPYSTILLFYHNKFKNYWFRSATPTFLINLLQKEDYDIVNVLNIDQPESIVSNSYEAENIELPALLFQTGYLTIKSYKESDDDIYYELDYPNYEVKKSFNEHLFAKYINQKVYEARINILDIKRYLEEESIDKFINLLKQMYSTAPYDVHENKEKSYQLIFFVILDILSLKINVEVHTNKGSIDAVIELNHVIYVVEFKLDESATTAMNQIKEKKYYEKYIGKRIYLIGISFSKEERNIKEYLVERIDSM